MANKNNPPKRMTFLNEQDFVRDFDTQSMDLIGEGAYGKVYKVKPTKLCSYLNPEEPCAIKIIETSKLDTFNRAMKELQFTGTAMSHQNIVPLYKVYSWSVSVPYTKYLLILVMQLMECNLKQLIQICKKTDTKMEKTLIEKIILQSLTVFEFLVREKHLFHRDIKPENILLTKERDIRIGDFGVSKIRLMEVMQTAMSNSIAGTPAYLSPILWDAYLNSKNNVQHNLEKSDVYSMGLTILQMILLLSEQEIITARGDEVQMKEQLAKVEYHNIRQCLIGMLHQEEQRRFTWAQALNSLFPQYQSGVSMRSIQIENLHPFESRRTTYENQNSSIQIFKMQETREEGQFVLYLNDHFLLYDEYGVRIVNHEKKTIKVDIKYAQDICVTETRCVVISDQGLMYLSLDGSFQTYQIKGAEDVDPANMRSVQYLDKNQILIALQSGEVLVIEALEPPVLRKTLSEHKNQILSMTYDKSSQLLLMGDSGYLMSVRYFYDQSRIDFFYCDYAITSLVHLKQGLFAGYGNFEEVLIFEVDASKSEPKLRIKENINLKAVPMSMASYEQFLVISTSHEFIVMDVLKQSEKLCVIDSPLQFIGMICTQKCLITYDGQQIVEWKVIGVRKHPPKQKGLCGMGCCSRCVLM